MTRTVPEQRVDRNGKTVTRHVRALPTGEPMIRIPVPQSRSKDSLAAEVFAKVFTDIDAFTGYLKSSLGTTSYVTPEFAVHALCMLPDETLRQVEGKLQGRESGARRYLISCLSHHIEKLYEEGQEPYAKTVLRRTRARIDNALLLYDAIEDLPGTDRWRWSDVGYEIGGALHRYEGRVPVEGEELEMVPVTTNYALRSAQEQRRMEAHFVAWMTRLENYSSRPTEELVSVIAENIERRTEIIAIMLSRGSKDPDMLREVLGSTTPALSDGML